MEGGRSIATVVVSVAIQDENASLGSDRAIVSHLGQTGIRQSQGIVFPVEEDTREETATLPLGVVSDQRGLDASLQLPKRLPRSMAAHTRSDRMRVWSFTLLLYQI